MSGLSITMLMGFCGLGADAASWLYQSRQLHAAADIAAFDGAVALNAGGTSNQITSAATSGASSNGWSSTNGTIAVNHPPKSGNYQNSHAVEVILTENATRYFTGVFSTSTVTIQARSVSTTQGTHVACVIALDSTANGAISMSGGAAVSSPNCDVVSDSSSSSSISMSGGATVTTPCLVAVGSVKTSGGASYTLNKCTSPTTSAPVATDPYSGVNQPSVPGSCITISGKPTTLSPGYYCHGISITWSGVTMQSGLYYVAGGNFSLSGGATVTGTGVTIFVAKGNNVSLSGGSTATFSAQTSGSYAGIVFFGDRSGGGTNSFSGGAATNITGAIYFPSQAVSYSGGTSDNSTCTQLIADTINFSGGASFGAACTGDGISTIDVADGGPGSIKVVE